MSPNSLMVTGITYQDGNTDVAIPQMSLSGVSTSLRLLFAFFEDFECNRAQAIAL